MSDPMPEALAQAVADLLFKIQPGGRPLGPVTRGRIEAEVVPFIEDELAECERRTWAAAAQIVETIGQRYAEQDASGTRYPAAETCAAVACAVNIAAAIRDAATKGA